MERRRRDAFCARRAIAPLILLLAVTLLPAAAEARKGGKLRAGAGRADITPLETGYYLGGYTRADRLAEGQHTRLHARALVLKRGGVKVALVSTELFMTPGGMLQDIAARLRDLGFTEQNILVSASHTHSGPGGFANFPTYNTAAPSIETVTDPFSFVRLLDPAPADRRLYTFLVERIAIAIARANSDLGRAAAGWGRTTLTGVTRNRSIEAHLANHGIHLRRGAGSARQDPAGALHSIDPSVAVLRVDKLKRRRRCPGPRPRGRCGLRRVPIGAWSNFADHGTVTKASFEAYNGDHHAAAYRVFEDRVRNSRRVPRRQDVVNVYGNSNEGDMSAGLDHSGPAGSDAVGRAEAAAMLRAWREAGRGLKRKRRPRLGLRWTRICFCKHAAPGDGVAADGRAGFPFLTGSEEERGPLFDVTGIPFEDVRSPVPTDDHGHKLLIPFGEFPNSVPLMVVRVGRGAIASLPGEPTKEVGARVKASVLDATREAGVRQATIAGLANEFISYITTPQEYDRQHYEGGSTLFGRRESEVLREALADLARRLADGRPAPPAHPFDARHGVRPDGPPYPAGAASGTITSQPPAAVPRLGHATFAWRGGPLGRDRPLDDAFVIVERRHRGRWRAFDSDLGLGVLWRVDAAGNYRAYWEVPLDAPADRYRIVVEAARYRLVFPPFRVETAGALEVEPVPAPPGRAAVQLDYPAAVENRDLRARPAFADGGTVRFEVGSRSVLVTRRHGSVFSVPARAGQTVRVPARAAADRHGNTNRFSVRVR